MAGYLEKIHRSIVPGQNSLKQLRAGPLRRETAVADLLETFEIWLSLKHFDNAEWIWRHWVEKFWKKSASVVRKVSKKGRRGNNRTATDLEECLGKKARSNIPEMPNTIFMVVICQVPNGNNDQTSSRQLWALYTDVRHWEELINFIEKNCTQKEQYCLTALYKCNLMQLELDEKYMGLYAPGQMMNDHPYGQIL